MGAYQKSKGLRTSFVGFFPADRPKYSCIVMVDNSLGGASDLYAGTVAAPVFKQVADRIYAYDLSLHAPAKLGADSGAVMVRWAGKASEMQVVATALNLSLPAEKVPEGTEWVQGSTGAKGKTTWQARSIDKSEVPDLRGLPLRDALFIMENKGFRVGFKGAGKVITQSLEPGSKVSGQKNIMLSLQ